MFVVALSSSFGACNEILTSFWFSKLSSTRESCETRLFSSFLTTSVLHERTRVDGQEERLHSNPSHNKSENPRRKRRVDTLFSSFSSFISQSNRTSVRGCLREGAMRKSDLILLTMIEGRGGEEKRDGRTDRFQARRRKIAHSGLGFKSFSFLASRAAAGREGEIRVEGVGVKNRKKGGRRTRREKDSARDSYGSRSENDGRGPWTCSPSPDGEEDVEVDTESRTHPFSAPSTLQRYRPNDRRPSSA